MTTPEIISDISLKLFQAGLFDKNVQPGELLKYINDLNATQISIIANAIGSKVEAIGDFFNTTLPCIYNMTTSVNMTTTNNTETSLMESIFSSW